MEPNSIFVPVVPISRSNHWMYAFIAIVAVVGIFTWWFILAGNGVSVTATTSTASVAVGQQFTVNILLDTDTLSVSAADLVVAYDAQLLKVVSIKSGGFLPVQLVGGIAKDGRVTMTVASGTSPVHGSGTVLTITFKAITAGKATIKPLTDTQIAAVGKTGNVIGNLTPVSVTIR